MRLTPHVWASSFDGSIREVFLPNADGLATITIQGPRRDAPMVVQITTHVDASSSMAAQWVQANIQVYVHDEISATYEQAGFAAASGEFVGLHIYHRAPPRPVN